MAMNTPLQVLHCLDNLPYLFIHSFFFLTEEITVEDSKDLVAIEHDCVATTMYLLGQTEFCPLEL